MWGEMFSKTAASHWCIRPITCHVHAWRIRACGAEEVICFSCHSWMRPAPLPTSTRSKHIELIRFIYGMTDGPIIIKPRMVPFPFQTVDFIIWKSGGEDGEERWRASHPAYTSGAWPHKTKVAVHSNKSCEMEQREGSGISSWLAL